MLLAEVLFYKWVIYLVFLLSGYESFSIEAFIKAAIPMIEVKTGFIDCYLFYYLSIPFINKLIASMNEIMHRRLLLLVGFIYIALGTIHQVSMNYFTWFIVLHLIAGYMRWYPKPVYERGKLWGMITLCSLLLGAVSVAVMAWAGRQFGFRRFYYFVSDSNTILAVVTGVSSFLFVKSIKLGPNRAINTIAASTFGVLLIHANNDVMRKWLWKDILNCIGIYSSDLMPLRAAGGVLAVFCVCTCIDLVRIRLIEKPFMGWWASHEKKIIKKFSVG